MAVGSKSLRVAKYVLLPQVLPRIAALFLSGFDYFAFFMAQVYRGVRLLPASHPYLNPAEIGNFSIPDAIGAAGRNLVYRKENIDQIIIYYVILLGLVLLVLQALFMAVSLAAPQAMALSWSYYFGTELSNGLPQKSTQDLAFILLDRVFGVPDVFNSCVSTATPCYRSTASGMFDTGNTIYKPPVFPWPYHKALHAMFQFYSTGLLMVGMLILLYFVLVIVAETAQTGTPFGRRFNKVWAPLRLVTALGLLIPISNGLNTAQYIVLYAAKLGSNFATEGWLVFNIQLPTGMPTDGSSIIAKPPTPSPNDLLQFMMLAHACKAVEEGYLKAPFNDKWTPDDSCSLSPKEQQFTQINGYLVKSTGNLSDDHVLLEQTNFLDAMAFFGKGDMTIRFGDLGCTNRHNAYSGHVVPVCGEVTMSNASLSEKNNGAYTIQLGYYELIKHLWGEYGSEPRIWEYHAYCDNTKFSNMMSGAADGPLRAKSIYFVQKTCPQPGPNDNPAPLSEPTLDWLTEMSIYYRYGSSKTDFPSVVTTSAVGPSAASRVVEQIIRNGLQSELNAINSGKYHLPTELLARGWGGAGMWYNQIAQGNGVMGAAAWEFPKVNLYPRLMNNMLMARMRNLENMSVGQIFSSTKSQDSSLQTERTADATAVVPMNDLYNRWMQLRDKDKPKGGNPIFDFINYLFGTRGLFDMRDPANQNVHPLALLTGLGKSLIEASIRNVAIGLAGQGAQILTTAGGSEVGSAISEAISNTAYNIATMTLTAGFILYYVLPFLPFMYFFFALGNWIKGIFEAMVGVPLWALAHIRIDGDGLPGGAALNGYFLIFEIFLRPILIVFGLVASVSIFAAMASTLNAIFPLAVNNLGGLDYTKASSTDWLSTARGPIDQLFYTVMYAVIMYIMGLASFKLIDLIPQQILRWMGTSVSAFNDGGGDPAQSLTQYAAIGGTQVTSGAISGIRGMGSAGVNLAKAARSE